MTTPPRLRATFYFRRETTMTIRKTTKIGMLAALGLIAMSMLPPNAANAQADGKITKAMSLMKEKAQALGAAKLDGIENVGGKTVPALFFGTTKMDGNFTLVDDIVKAVGGTATLFVRSGEDYVRVATNVKKDDGTRAIGTILDPNGKAILSINKDEAFSGEVTILDKPYVTGYEPIHDAANNVIGIFYVGYLK